MTQLIRSASLEGYVALARACGLDPYKILDSAGIPRSCLTQPDLKLSIESYRLLLEESASLSGADDFGVRLAESRQLSTFGPVGLVVRQQPTVRKAIEALAQNIRLHNESAFVEIEETDEIVVMKPALTLQGGAPAQQSADMVLGVMCRILTLLLGPHWRPLSVCFVRSPPHNPAAHWRVFGRALEFNQDFNGIVCLRTDMDRPIAGADPGLAREAERYVEMLSAQRERDAARDVKQVVVSLLPTGQCTIDRVAEHLGMNRRTIHRHLAAKDMTFSELVDQTRKELASSYLEAGNRPLASVAELLGFSALSSFSHWHKQHFGVTPSARRAGAQQRQVVNHD